MRAGFFGKSYALGMNVTIDAQHSPEQEIRHVNECFINWLRNRGKKCKTLILAFVAPAESHAQIRDLAGQLMSQPLGMGDIINRLDITLVIINSATGESTEHDLKCRTTTHQ